MQKTESGAKAKCWPCMILGTLTFAGLVALAAWGIYKLLA